MNIISATTDYENWLGTVTSVLHSELEIKHAKMADTAFAFLRATFYRWAQLFPLLCPDLNQAVKVLGIGDVHIENFGTWRDVDGRLCWGVNDFDESCFLPF